MEHVLTVTQLNEYVRRTLAADPMLRSVKLRGEISNYKLHSAGHLYFTLKDEASRVACVMFRSAAAGLSMRPRDGMRVVLTGSAALYPAAGQYQFYVDAMRDDGVGALYEEFERLKARLMEEGLFDPALKKPLPLLPRGVGIVTSPTGAVVHDIQQVSQRRHPGVQLMLRSTAVQGAGAAEDIVRGIRALDARPDIDVIIVGRGGGSLEDLWPFNEEIVARAIFACKTPVVSAVGHETDFTIADFVADVRAATPSQAAELAVPRLEDLQEMLAGFHWRISRAQAQRIALLGHRLDSLMAKLTAQRPDKRLAHRRATLTGLRGLMDARARAAVAGKRHQLAALRGKLTALSPQQVLSRGYALVTDAGGALVTDAMKLTAGDTVRVRLRAGAANAAITEVYNGEETND